MIDRGEVVSRVIRLRELVEDGRRRDGSVPAEVVAEIEIVLEGLEVDLVRQWCTPLGAAA